MDRTAAADKRKIFISSSHAIQQNKREFFFFCMAHYLLYLKYRVRFAQILFVAVVEKGRRVHFLLEKNSF